MTRTDRKGIGWPGARASLATLVALSLITLGEIRLFHRLLYTNQAECQFVALSVDGVVHGRPVYKSWQGRFLGPWVVSALDRVTASRLESLKLVSLLTLVAGNILLFAVVQRRGGSPLHACLAVAAFGFCRLLLLYKLEYPWDGVNVVLFLLFGHLTATRRSLPRLWPLLLVGLLNHEAVLYLPLWYLLSPLDRPWVASRSMKEMAAAAAVLLIMAAGILGMRASFYQGRPALIGHVFERETPIVGNPTHLLHNLGQLFAANWRNDRAFISLAVLSAIVLLVALVAARRHTRAAVWSLVLLTTILCFGYVNETRLYLVLVAFWFAHAWPVPPACHDGPEK